MAQQGAQLSFQARKSPTTAGPRPLARLINMCAAGWQFFPEAAAAAAAAAEGAATLRFGRQPANARDELNG